ncbi:hypothetical protein ACKWTF_013242 [Chironomus riparius]
MFFFSFLSSIDIRKNAINFKHYRFVRVKNTLPEIIKFPLPYALQICTAQFFNIVVVAIYAHFVERVDAINIGYVILRITVGEDEDEIDECLFLNIDRTWNVKNIYKYF